MTASFCGLICCPMPPEEGKPKERLPVPLKSIAVHAEVRGWTVGVTAELAYENKMPETIECQFVFPLTDTSAVYRLEADIDGKKLTAECKPRKEAEDVYRDAVDAGQAGVLLESQTGSPDVFRIMLGNLPPNKEAKVTIGFVQPVERDVDGALTVTLPAVLNPRYVPREMFQNAEKMKDHFHFKVPYVAVSEVSYTMNFDAKINLGINAVISEIATTNKADTISIQYDHDKQNAEVFLDKKFVQDHDFGFRIVPAEPFQPMVFLEPGQSGTEKNWLSYDIACASFEPETSKDKALGVGVEGDEYWLVIDRSGSMEGEKIKDAKTALVLFVKSLPMGCKFNIVGFGSTFLCLFPDGSVEYSDETITKAVAHSNELEADLGGTEILQPLEFIYKQPKPTAPGSRQFIVLLTDGEVGNTEQVIDIAKKNAATTRLFTIGIGEGASTALVNGMARVSGGVSEFVRSATDRLQAKVISLLKAATNPAAENMKVEWQISDGKLVSKLPDSIPTAAYQGRPIMQYILIERNQGLNVTGSSILTASIGGTPVTHKLPFNIGSSVSTPAGDVMPLHRLAAKAKIQELNDQRYTAPDRDAWEKEIVSISVATGVLCEETAFVAVDPATHDAAKDSKGKPHFVDIERPTSYGGFGFGGAHIRMMRCAPMMPCAMMAMPMGAAPPPPAPCNAAPMGPSRMKKAAKGKAMKESVAMDMADFSAPLKEEVVVDEMDQLVRLQNFNGSWSMSDKLAKLISPSKPLADIRREIGTALGGKVTDDKAIGTLIGLVVLRRKFSTRHDEWELLEQKAVAFLSKSLGSDVDKFVEAIAKAFSL